jgi:hypothetical protein
MAQVPRLTERPADLAGTITLQVADQHVDFLTRNLVALLVEQDLRPVGPVYAHWTAIPRAAIADPPLLEATVAHTVQKLRVWDRWDRAEWPRIYPLPRLARLAETARRKRQRVAVWFLSRRRKDAC